MSAQLMEEKQNIKNSEDTMIFWSRVAWLNVFSMMKQKTDINASLTPRQWLPTRTTQPSNIKSAKLLVRKAGIFTAWFNTWSYVLIRNCSKYYMRGNYFPSQGQPAIPNNKVSWIR